MSTIEKNFNYLIMEQVEVNTQELIAEIATFFAKQYNRKIIIITKRKLSTEDAQRLFGSLTSNERKSITLMYCKNYRVVLEKLLEIDSSLTIPKVLLIESLHQWYNDTTDISQLPSISSTIFAAAQDLVNTCSRILKENCYSFISSCPDELPTRIVELFYDYPIRAGKNCLNDVYLLHKNNSRDAEQVVPTL